MYEVKLCISYCPWIRGCRGTHRQAAQLTLWPWPVWTSYGLPFTNYCTFPVLSIMWPFDRWPFDLVLLSSLTTHAGNRKCSNTCRNYYRRQGRYVCLFFCVCLLATFCKSYCTDVHENFITAVSVDKEELIKFWNHPLLFPDAEIFWRILEHCEIGHFSTIWLISLDKLNRSSRKFCHKCSFAQGSPRWISEVAQI